MSKKKNILVVAAHPDDEVLGCGATIAEHTLQGDKVIAIILGEGLTSRLNFKGSDKHAQLQKLKKCSERAASVLGISDLVFLDLPDNQFDSLPLLSILHKLEPYFVKYPPHTVYTHFEGDVNIDHKITNCAVTVLTRPVPSSPTKLVLNFETPSSTEWNFSGNGFLPNYFIPVSAVSVKNKIRALMQYKGEIRPFPHPRSGQYLNALAQVRGSQAGVRLAEAFKLQYFQR